MTATPADPGVGESPMNSSSFLEGQREYFAGSYEQFAAFGGPAVYFHRECLRAAEEAFLGVRHIEMLYATLAAWGMHRTGDADKTKTKLTDWERFYGSITANAQRLRQLREWKMLGSAPGEYLDAVRSLRPIYETLDLTRSGATVVVNSKALHHILPEFIPPIDRQYTVRFLTQAPEKWRDASGKYRLISLPAGIEAQFRVFCRTCGALKQLADRVDPALFEEERRQHAVPAPKALDNAIVNYIRIVGAKAQMPITLQPASDPAHDRSPAKGRTEGAEVAIDDFRAELERQLAAAAREGKSSVRINAGDLHRGVGGYPGRNHRMPMCCQAMRSVKTDGDKIVESPPKGNGARLTIEYRLPRPKPN